SHFDPYHRWLGIPPEKQPPNHYVLLAIEPFEKNPDVIATAADQRMVHLRTYQSGRHTAASQKLLNEVAGARVCLLNPTSKAQYDEWLRKVVSAEAGGSGRLPGAPPAPPPSAPPPVAPPKQIRPVQSPRVERFKRGKAKRPKSPAKSAEDKGSGRTKTWLIAALCTVCGLLVVGLAILIFSSKGGKTEETALVFDWPESDREGTTLYITGQERQFSGSGPLVCPCKPGKHHVRAVREGFEPHDQSVTVAAGERRQVEPPKPWKPLPPSHLVLCWPAHERGGASLEIDGKAQDLVRLAVGPDPDRLDVPLEPGSHTLRISQGGESFDREFTILAGNDREMHVSGTVGHDTPPSEPQVVEGGGKLAVPSEDVQRDLRERIDYMFNVAEAATVEQKLDIAGRMLNDGTGNGRSPADRYVHLLRAMELAAECGDGTLMLKAVSEIGTRYEADVPAIRRQAFTIFVRHHPDPSAIGSLAETADDRLMIGDAFWDLAQAAKDQARENLMLAAGGFYEQVLRDEPTPEIETLLKPRLDEIAVVKEARRIAALRAEGEGNYVNASGVGEQNVTAWDFRSAAAELEKLRFEDDYFNRRLASRVTEVQRMAAMKARFIAKINAAQPRLTRGDLLLPGIPASASIERADESAMTAALPTGKTETHPWAELNARTVQRLVELAGDPDSVDDWIAGGLLSLACADADSAGQFFGRAQALGADVNPYLGTIASTVLARAGELAAEAEFGEAIQALAGFEEKYAKIPWFAENEDAFRAVLAEAHAGDHENQAQGLYEQATRHFADNELFELKRVLDQLGAEYARTRAVTDTAREPSFGQMAAAVADLGKLIIVRADGRGDFKTIQEAVDAAVKKSLIEIRDEGPYNEKIEIPGDKEGLTLRGAKDLWPMITSVGQRTNFAKLVTVNAPQITLQRLALVHAAPAGAGPRCVQGYADQLTLDSCILFCPVEATVETNAAIHVRQCVVIGRGAGAGPISAEDTLWIGRPDYGDRGANYRNVVICSDFEIRSPCELRACTITGSLRMTGQPNVLVDCILPTVEATQPDTRIEYCDVYGNEPSYIDNARAGKGCFNAPPQPTNPTVFDFRPAPRSPLSQAASDGGALGCRYTPEMIEMLKFALRLRSNGSVKF
ncbi:MAG TPA: hypothetical protein VMY42_01770, partial [Thermoguttaceae bacterium]|nr:hypothetical protein [Thermoguttaceae bacterium]